MNCPSCGAPANIQQEQATVAGVRRSRRCSGCDRRFTTYERIHITAHMVLKSDGRLESFSPSKLRHGIGLALTKRSTAPEAVATAVETRLLHETQTPLTTKRVAAMVMEELLARDWIAYVRYASVCRHFPRVEDFIAFVSELPAAGVNPAQSRLWEG